MQSLDIPPVPVFPTYWLQGPYIKPDFDKPYSYFIVGNPDTGKSNQSMAYATNYLAAGHKLIDAFGVGATAEELIWFLSPYKDRTVMIHGDDVEVQTKFAKVKISDFTLETLQDYDIAVTTRGLFSDDAFGEISHYHALSKIFSLCKKRRGYKSPGPLQGKIVVLMVREAWEIIYSQIRAGISKDEQDAQREIKKLDKQKFHTGIAPLLDSQRYPDIDKSVRQLTNFRVIKGFGGQEIPDEFTFLFRPNLFMRTPWKLRNLPPDEFIMVTSWNGVATGLVDKVPWNKHKGEDLLDLLEIKVTTPEKEGAKPPERPDAKPAEHPYRKLEEHNQIIDLHNQGLNYTQIEKAMREAGHEISWQKARYHVLNKCSCLEVHTG